MKSASRRKASSLLDYVPSGPCCAGFDEAYMYVGIRLGATFRFPLVTDIFFVQCFASGCATRKMAGSLAPAPGL